MRALLDTHTFLWWNLDAPQLSAEAREFIAKGSNEIFLSAASAWEIAIKASKGRLTLPEPPDQYVADRMRLRFRCCDWPCLCATAGGTLGPSGWQKPPACCRN